MKYLIKVTLLLASLVGAANVHAQIDPQGCRATAFTTQEWRDIGFEPLNAAEWGVNPNDNVDDTAGIQAAIDSAVINRRSIMAFWGANGYIITPQATTVAVPTSIEPDGTVVTTNQTFRAALHIKQEIYNRDDDRHTGNFGERYATILKGSNCGNERPFFVVPDGVDNNRSFTAFASNPSVMVAITRDYYGDESNSSNDNSIVPVTQDSGNNNDPLDFTEGSRDWNQGVDGVDFVTGNNSGVVAIRHLGAEGSSAKNIRVDATGGFAGLYHANASGGYTHNVEVQGGLCGVFNEFARGGTMTLNGLTLKQQIEGSLCINHYAPVTVVGGVIENADGRVYKYVTGQQGSYSITDRLRTASHNSGGHVSFVDTSIEITGAGNNPILDNTDSTDPGTSNRDGRDRSIYFKNVYLKGSTLAVENRQGGNLQLSNNTDWHLVEEYSYSGATTADGQAARLVDGVRSDDTWFDGAYVPRANNITLQPSANPPSDLQTRHLYPEYMCNVERPNVQFITDFGAVSAPFDDANGSSNNISIDNSQEVQAAIDAAQTTGSNIAYIPRGGLIIEPQGAGKEDHRLLEVFHVRNTITLKDNVQLCGVARGTSTLSAGSVEDSTRWKPTSDSPIIETTNSATSAAALMRVQLFVPNADNVADPYVYAIDWSAGENSVVVDAWWRYDFGNPGRRVTVKINGNGGGKWYGVTQQGGYPPHQYNNPPGANGTERRSNQSLYPYDNAGVPNVAAGFLVSPDVRHMVVDGTSNPLTFYSFHCQHIIIPEGGQCDVLNSSNVTFHGIKQEAASVPDDMEEVINDNPAEITPNWMTIHNSHDILLNSYETHAQYACGRGAIEVTGNSYNITMANLGRRSGGTSCPQSDWGIIREVTDDRDILMTSQTQYISLFKSEQVVVVIPPTTVGTGSLLVDRPYIPLVAIESARQTIVSEPLEFEQRVTTLDGYVFWVSTVDGRELWFEKNDGIAANIVGWVGRIFSNGNHSFAVQRTTRLTGLEQPLRVFPDITLDLSNVDSQYFRWIDVFSGNRYFVIATGNGDDTTTITMSKEPF